MKVVTTRQMRRIDEVTIQERGIPGITLMERAGTAVATEAMDRFEPDAVAIVTGKGNNAGDGFIAARELLHSGVRTTLYMLAPPEELTGDALDAFRMLGSEITPIVAPPPQELQRGLARHELVIDAIFGTGIRGPVGSPWAEAIEAINASGALVLAVDIPSGMPGDPAYETELGPHVRATTTVTIGLPKLGMILDPGVRSTGNVVVADIGFPRDLLDDPAIGTNLMTMEEARALLPVRKPAGYKGTFGRVLILGGSEGMTGAAIMAARAATRSGAGLIYVSYPHLLGTVMESNLIEPVKLPLQGEAPWFTSDMVEHVVQEAAKMEAVGIGPGIGLHEETKKFLHEVIARVAKPMVIDASALDLLADDLHLLKERQAPTILTPHIGEAARLLHLPAQDVMRNRLDAFTDFARDYNVVAVLKGAQTVVTDPASGQRYINPTGNSGLAKGGSGDVLTGLTAGLLAQGMTALDAARLGVFMHGMAGDVTAGRLGVRAMLPGDVIESLGPAFLKLEKND
jgi:NAD(P)H-hydrate epimerase